MSTLDDLIADSWFPFAGDITLKPLEPRVIPEPERFGTAPEDCGACKHPDTDFVWTNDRWRLFPMLPTQIPGLVLLQPREHLDSFTDFSAELLADLGPMTARIERVLLELGNVGRVHVNKWGDGGLHFHLWFMPRPLGMLQLRGSMLPMWLDFMPNIDDAEARATLARIGAALAEVDGTAHPIG